MPNIEASLSMACFLADGGSILMQIG